MRQARADEDEIALAVRFDVVADEARAVTAHHPDQFEFRVIVPGVIFRKTLASEPQAAERACGIRLDGFKTWFHFLPSGSAAAAYSRPLSCNRTIAYDDSKKQVRGVAIARMLPR